MNNAKRSVLLRGLVLEASANPTFVHHRWYAHYHLEIVAQIAAEACNFYPDADRVQTLDLVWIHDYEKIVDVAHKDNRELAATRALLERAGFDESEINELAKMVNRMNEKRELTEAPIEVQIASSADGASHVVGPFMDLYWYENPTKTITDIQEGNRRKIEKDWALKITIPEIRTAFEQRRRHELEAVGQLPPTYLT